LHAWTVLANSKLQDVLEVLLELLDVLVLGELVRGLLHFFLGGIEGLVHLRLEGLALRHQLVPDGRGGEDLVHGLQVFEQLVSLRLPLLADHLELLIGGDFLL